MAAVLLDAGAEVNARDSLGSPPLVYVHPQTGDTPTVAQAKADFVRLLLRAGADVNARPTYGDGLLHEALEAGNQEILAALLEAHADVNLKGRNRLPLELAAERGDMDTIKLLLQAGADAKAGDDYRNALSIALHRKNGPLAALLLNSGASLSNLRNLDVLQEAIREGWSDVVKLVLRAGADVNLLRESQTVNGDGSISGGTPMIRPLNIALEVKKPEMVALLIANKADVNLGDQERQTPLHLAACADGDVLVRLLLDARARVNARDVWQATPLHKAVSCRNEAARQTPASGGRRRQRRRHQP